MDDKVTKGIILLIIGLGITLYFQPLIADYETDIGKAQRLYDSDEQRTYEIYLGIRTIGIILMVVGAIIILMRIVETQKKPFQQPYPQQKYQQPSPQPTPHSTQKQINICKNCYAKLDVSWASCPYCGYQQATQQQIKYCKNCKRQVTSDFTYCPYCSQSLISDAVN